MADLAATGGPAAVDGEQAIGLGGPGLQTGTVFVTVGSMLPFDRLVQAVDMWAAAHPLVDTFIQIGDGEYLPRHAPWARRLTPADFGQRVAACDLFVAHAGIGSIVQALEASKQILVFARHASLGEHTTDHQLDTVARFRDTPGLAVADDVPALGGAMSALLSRPMRVDQRLGAFGPSGLVARIRDFLVS
ncbi:glycosyltransferase [Sphingomonas bacterium]|uniref:glycosyltransferase n=1 Tax=Sphingomonas bacterium TaxID=1895847 RepID=UPI001576726B|nr:glycosyltransferase [Sphingomonas bacterium]